MAILQVNVRPAARSRHMRYTRRGGQAGDFQTRLRQRHLSQGQSADSNGLHPNRSSERAHLQSNAESNYWQTIVWRLTPGTTVGRAQLSATQRLRDAGSLTASLDAQLLLAHLFRQDRSWLFTHHEQELSSAEAEAYTELVARRAAGEPIAYLIGRREFYDINLNVDSRVLIPRPETEFLVDAALNFIAIRHEKWGVLNVADVGTGSGAIALSIARHTQRAKIVATDISARALSVARSNAAALRLAARVDFRQGDLLAPLEERLHLLVANLPYIKDADYKTLDADVRNYEPRVALEAGHDGLDVIRRLLEQAADHMLPGGQILLEIGYDQGEAVRELALALLPNLHHVSIEQDYAGLDRVVRIQLR